MIELSIITVTLNNASALEKTLTSLARQTSKAFEVSVIDGKSSDNTSETVRQFSSFPLNFISEKDAGIYDAQNKGILISKGKYLLFLNAGDVLYNDDVIKNFLEGIRGDEDIVYGNIVIAESDGSLVPVEYPDRIGYIYWYRRKYLCHQAVFFRKSLFEKKGLYDISYKLTADFDFLQRVWFDDRVIKKHIPLTIVCYDLAGASSDVKNRESILREYREIRRKYHPLLINLFLTFVFEYPPVYNTLRSAARFFLRAVSVFRK